MSNDELVTVIVPLYNKQCFIEECIESIRGQSVSNIEILIIDDGSTDKSLNICESLQKMDERIKIIRTNHRGAVYARKCGVKYATGKFVMFVDGDDYIDEYLVETLLNRMEENIDMVSTNICTEGKKNVMESTLLDGVYEGENLHSAFEKIIYDEQLNCPGLLQSLCAKLFRKEKLWKVIENENDNISLGDDAAVVYLYALSSDRIALFSDCLYYYRMDENSMTHTLKVDTFYRINQFLEYMKGETEKYPIEWQLDRQIHMYIIHFLQMAISSVYNLNVEQTYFIDKKFQSDDRLAIYGVGRVGKSIVTSLYNKVSKIILFDRNKAGEEYRGNLIYPPEKICETDFDYIIVTVKDINIAKEIITMIKEMGIDGSKIYWESPKIENKLYTIDY